MATETLVFVVLPNGITAQGRLRLSLYLTPRLEAGATLAVFPDILDWPDLIKRKGLSFKITCGANVANVPANRRMLRPDVWREIFTPHTYVAPFRNPDFDKRLIVSYPVRDALAYLNTRISSRRRSPHTWSKDSSKHSLPIWSFATDATPPSMVYSPSLGSRCGASSSRLESCRSSRHASPV